MNDHSFDQMEASDAVDLSIILPTRNRAAKLAVTLEYLRALHVPQGYKCEIVVVDNGSTDETARVCQGYANNSSIPFRREYAPLAGLSRARNAGIRASTGRILAFLDDDIHPMPDWLIVIAHELAADPSLGMLCGRVELQNPGDLPMGIRRMKDRKYFAEVDDAFYLSAGGNWAARRTLFDRIGLFDSEFGPGSRFPAAEDAEFSYRAWRSGEKILYVPEMFVLHDHGRSSSESGFNLTREYVWGRGAFDAKCILQGDRMVARYMYWEIRSGLRRLIRDRQKHVWRNLLWLVQGFFHYVWFRLTHPRSRREEISLQRGALRPVK